MTTVELIDAESQPEPGDPAPEAAPRAERHRPGRLPGLRPRALRFRLGTTEAFARLLLDHWHGRSRARRRIVRAVWTLAVDEIDDLFARQRLVLEQCLGNGVQISTALSQKPDAML